MSAVSLHPYIFFTGNCREAMTFYQTVFGGELHVQTYEEAGETMPGTEGRVMHATIKGGEIDLMASDSTRDKFEISFISLSLNGTDEAKLTSLFEKLSKGANVTAPLKKESWGDVFGTLTDKFGVDWMVNIEAQA